VADRAVGTRKAPQLALRAVPTQARARQTFQHLLETAAAILEKVGVDEFNTNLLAERAGVGIRTVYRYFPNKLSVLAALSEHIAQVTRDSLDGFEALADPANPWEDAIDQLIDTYVAVNENHPALPAIFATLLAVPELEPVRARIYDDNAERLAAALQQRGVELPERMRQRVAHTLINSSSVVEEWMLRRGAGSREFVEEYKLLLHSYLAPIMD